MSTTRVVPLLHGPYAAPSLRRGDRATCLYRDREVKVTAWSDAPISWPRGHDAEKPCGPGGLIVNEELARAVRCESATAVSYWWRVGRMTVIKWRRALGATRQNNEGSQVLIHAATAKALEAAREAGLTPEECRRRSKLASEVQPWRFGPRVTHGKEWTPQEAALLGTMRDAEVAGRTGHTLYSVRNKRRDLGIPGFRGDGPVGASFEPRTGRWFAKISVRGKQVSLGTHDTKEEAQRAYQEAARRFRG